MQAIPRELTENNWVVLLFILGFILLFLMKIVKPSRLLGYAISFLTTGFFKKRIEEKLAFFSAFKIFLFAFSVLSLSLFFYTLGVYFKNYNSFLSFFTLFLAVFVYLSIRYLIDFFLIKLFGISNYVRYFIYTKTGYLYTLAIWLFPLLIIYFYGFKNNYFLWIGFLILWLIRFGLVFYNNKKQILKHLFYFILYLCALEIAPLLILLKILKEVQKI